MKPATRNESQTVHPILSLERMRCEALERRDMEMLGDLFSDTLTYVHSNGLIHDRAQYLSYLRDKVSFVSVRRSEMSVTHWGSVALSGGLMRLEGRRLAGGVTFSSVSFVTQAWTNHGSGWKLSLMQSTKVDDAMWRASDETP